MMPKLLSLLPEKICGYNYYQTSKGLKSSKQLQEAWGINANTFWSRFAERGATPETVMRPVEERVRRSRGARGPNAKRIIRRSEVSPEFMAKLRQRDEDYRRALEARGQQTIS